MNQDNNDKPREFWLDHLSVDEIGWMDAIPVQDGDADTYPGQTKVIEYSAYEASQARVMELEDKISELETHLRNAADIKAFKAGANWQSQRDAERAKILVEAIQSYLEVQKFLAKPDDDNCVSSSDFRIALRKYNGEE